MNVMETDEDTRDSQDFLNESKIKKINKKEDLLLSK